MMLFRRTCKEATALMLAREDRALPLADRVALQLHLAVCRACPVVEKQVLTMRHAMRAWRNYTQSDAE